MKNLRQSTLTFIGPKPETRVAACVLYDTDETVTLSDINLETEVTG